MPKLNSQKFYALGALALFNFVFLGSEFHYDIEVGRLVGSSGVVAAQGVILGASVVGFLGHAAAERLLCGALGRARTALAGALAAGCLLAIRPLGSAAAVQAAGAVCFLVLGLMGASAHAAFSRAFAGEGRIASAAGCSYAAGILMQFANNILVPQGFWESIVLCVGLAVLAVCLMWALGSGRAVNDAEGTADTKTSGQPLARALWSVALVVILACTFSTLDGVVTVANAEGTYAVQTWPRLFLAASGLASGIALDTRGGRYRGPIMFCVALLSVLSILAVEAGAPPLIGLVVFYLGSGCFVTFFTTLFATLAPGMRAPELWAGMGRAANNACAFTIAGASMAVVEMGPVAVMIASVLLVVVASVAFLKAGLFRLPGDEAATATPAGPTPQERKQAFIDRAGLTPRETEVLFAVTCDDRPLKQIAADLGISMRMVQRHLTSIYAKTGTQSRTGLTSKFLSQGINAANEQGSGTCSHVQREA